MHQPHRLLVILLCCPLLLGAAPARAESADVHRDQADLLYAGGQYLDALREYEATYAAQQAPRLLYLLARTHQKLGHVAEARSHYVRFLAAEPEAPPDLRAAAEAQIAHLGRLSAPPVLTARAPTAAPTPGAWSGVNRIYARLRPFGLFGYGGTIVHGSAGGLMAQVGFDHQGARGLRVGVELSPASFIAGEGSEMAIGVSTHVGRSAKLWAAGLGLGITFFYRSSDYSGEDQGALPIVQLEPRFRIGAIDRSHLDLRIDWVVLPPWPLPTSAEIDIILPATRRLLLEASAGGGYAPTYYYGVYGTLGVQYLLRGQGLRRTTLLSAGAGVAWLERVPGPLFLIGVEQRL